MMLWRTLWWTIAYLNLLGLLTQKKKKSDGPIGWIMSIFGGFYTWLVWIPFYEPFIVLCRCDGLGFHWVFRLLRPLFGLALLIFLWPIKQWRYVCLYSGPLVPKLLLNHKSYYYTIIVPNIKINLVLKTL
jgi:hypothetical protein